MTAKVETLFDSKEISKYLDSLERKLVKAKNGERELGAIMSSTVFRDIIEHFEEARGPVSNWEPWSEAYRAHMERIGKGGNNLLIDSGILRGSVTPSSGQFRGESGGILFYTNVEYAARQNKKREFMWVSDNALESVAGQVLNWLAEE